jgi:putative oxidoreductase
MAGRAVNTRAPASLAGRRDHVLERIFRPLAPLSHLFIRLPLGIIFAAHGGQHLFGLAGGQGFRATVLSWEHHLGVPPAVTTVVLAFEFFGGLAVLSGFATRLAALGLAASMLFAIVRVHWTHGFFINWGMVPGRGHGIEMNLALLGMCLMLVVGGAGRYAIERHD